MVALWEVIACRASGWVEQIIAVMNFVGLCFERGMESWSVDPGERWVFLIEGGGLLGEQALVLT